MAILTPEDLAPFANIEAGKAGEMIADAEAMAALAAPCMTDEDFLANEALVGALKAIMRRAIVRWNEAGTGALTQVGAGSFQMSTDNRLPSRSLYWPSEIAQLRELCALFTGEDEDRAFTVSMIPTGDGTSLASRPDLWFQHIQPTPPGAP